jgi:hypothetical protein
VLLLAGSNGEAAELARQVQGMLRMMGRVGEPQVELSDGNTAGVADRIRARLNAAIDAGGQLLTNRDTLRITKVTAGSVVAQRKTGPDTWSGQFTVPAAYLAESAELDYAGNAHVAQGRTVDVGHLLVSQTLSRRALYVGMTRGRHENYAHVETGNTAPPGKPAYEQAGGVQAPGDGGGGGRGGPAVGQQPPAGWYRARIQANSTPLDPPQGFALALSGRITATDHPWREP